jgi:hypothetical protein
MAVARTEGAGMKQNGREQFEAYYAKAGGCLLASVKEKHWQTWLAAQYALLSAKGLAVEMTILKDEEKAHD